MPKKQSRIAAFCAAHKVDFDILRAATNNLPGGPPKQLALT
jgi:hypothetical protein